MGWSLNDGQRWAISCTIQCRTSGGAERTCSGVNVKLVTMHLVYEYFGAEANDIGGSHPRLELAGGRSIEQLKCRWGVILSDRKIMLAE
jgi:hypothetical protein